MTHAGFGRVQGFPAPESPSAAAAAARGLRGTSLPGKQLLVEPALGNAIQPTESEQIASVGTKSFTPKGV